MKKSYIHIIKQLEKFASAFSAISTLEEVVESVERIIEGTFNVEYTGFYLYNFSEDRLKLHFAKGLNEEEFRNADQSAMERHPGYVYRSGKMIYIPDTLLDDRKLIESSERSYIVRSMLYLPVMNGRQVVGVFGILDSKPNAWNNEDITMFSFICNMAGALYANILNQSESKKMALIARESDNAVVITNKTGEIEWINHAFTLLTKYKFEEIKGENAFKKVHPEDHEAIINDFNSLLHDSSGSVTTEFRYLCRDGNYKWVQFMGINLLYDKDIHGILGNFHDITARKKEEINLSLSESRLKFALETAADGMWDWDIANNRVFYSTRWKKMLGYFEFEIGNTLDEWIKLVHPDDVKAMQADFEKYRNGKTDSYKNEHRIRCKDGSYKWVQYEGKVVKRDDQGKALRIIGANKDISIRKEVKKKLKESEERYRLLFENMEEGFSLNEIITNEKGEAVDFRFLEVNAAYEHHTGMKASECIGRTMLEIMPQADPRQIEAYGKVALTGKSLAFEYYSNTIHKHIRIKAFCPQPGRFATIFEDITDIKKAEQQLKESESRFKNMFAHHGSVMMLVDPETGVIIDANLAASEFYGYSNTELREMSINDINVLTPKQMNEFRKEVVSGRKNSFIVTHKLASGEKRIVEVHSSLIDIEGKRILFGVTHDITERKVAEENLNKLSQTVEQSPVMAYITDIDGAIEYINPKTLEITGYTKEELLGRNPMIFSSGESSMEVYTDLWQTIRSGKEWKGEFHNRKKNGTLYWVSASLSPIFGNNGEITHFVAIEEDITQRKADNEALQIANLRFKSLISSMQVGIMVEDEHRRVVLVNQYFCDLFSIPVSPEQLIGFNCAEAAESSKLLFLDPGMFISDINDTLRIGKIVINHELQMISGKTLERDFVPIENAEKKNQGILWIYREITQRKKIEKDLKRQSKLLRGTALALNHLLTITDHDLAMQKALETIGIAANVDRAYIFDSNVNQDTGETYLTQRFEWTAEGITSEMGNPSLLNMPFSEGFPKWYQLLSSGHTLSGMVKDLPDHEREFLENQDIISIIVVPVFVNGQFWGTVGFDDCSKGIQWSASEESILAAFAAGIGGSISREIIGKELINARQSAEKATKIKSDFLATMSHEIRTPLNGVIGMTSLLLQTHLTPDQLDYAETIKLSGELLLNVINDILDFSKIESDKMTLEEHSFDLRMAIEDILDLLALAASQKKLGLYYQIDPEIPQNITGDLTRLRQILVNLAGNAIKFTTEGEVVIVIKQLEKQEDKAILEFTVRDTGIGIPEEKMDQLFKPFSQVDTSITRKYGGSGLGLAICLNLVKMMDGNIRVISEVNRGSEFIFTIKTTYRPEERVTDDTLEIRKSLKGKKILIADHHSTNNAILGALFENLGMETFSAFSANMTMELIHEKGDFDLMVIDHDLLDNVGPTPASEIRKIIIDIELPVILISSPYFTGNGTAINGKLMVRINKPLKHSQLISSTIDLLSNTKSTQVQNNFQHKEVFQISEIYPLKILVAEDNSINQKLILRLFQMLGYVIQIAANGYEVIEALNRMKIDIIFMDVQMPEMDGLEATRRIIDLWGNQKPYIVAMTANAQKSDKEKCLEAGMDDYISKPLTIDQMKTGIEKWARLLNIKK